LPSASIGEDRAKDHHHRITTMRAEPLAEPGIPVWDLPTRLFHWALLLLVALAWITGEAGSALFPVHRLAGYGVAVLLLFRLIWGFLGGRHARFAEFVRPWPAVREHLRALARLRPPRTLGHNPLGGWMVLLMLAVLAAQVVTGLFGAGGEAKAGPLAAWLPSALAHAVAELHEALSGALLALIALHVLGVLVESLLTRENLVRAMLTGKKPAGDGDIVEGRPAIVAPAWLAAVVLAGATGIVWALVA
jgi:cytochrome b